MMKKQTAVEWLQSEIENFIDMGNTFTNEFEQAKAMEKEQIIDAVDGFPLDKRHLEGEQYYNETYGK
jgi:uncharacterized protein (UPF0276 family)